MTSVIARGLAVVAALAGLAATAACGGGGTTQQTSTGPAEIVQTGPDGDEDWSPSPEGGEDDGEADGSVFPGSDSEEPSASAIRLPRTEVGEATTGEVKIRGSKEQSAKPLQGVTGHIEGEELDLIRKCLGEVPVDGCDVIFQYTPTRPGPYTGELVFTMDDGSTVTAPISGEALEGSDTTSTPSSEHTTTSPPETSETPETTESETEE